MKAKFLSLMILLMGTQWATAATVSVECESEDGRARLITRVVDGQVVVTSTYLRLDSAGHLGIIKYKLDGSENLQILFRTYSIDPVSATASLALNADGVPVEAWADDGRFNPAHLICEEVL